MYYLILFAALVSQPAIADKLLWELGASLNAIEAPMYAGSRQSRQFLLPLPYLKLRHPLLEIDQGVRAFVFKNPRLNLNISADLGLPVSSKNSRLREAMPDLKTVLQIGPSLEFSLLGQHNSPSELRFDLPLRLALASDIKQTQAIGWIIEPRLSFHSRRDFQNGLAFVIESGLRFASRDYQAYYYDVSGEFATANRPAFQTSAGYNGFFMDAGISWRQHKLTLFAFIRYQNINNTPFIDSPLVESSSYLLSGLSLIYLFASNS